MPTKSKTFVEPVLRGSRFSEHEVPLDVLADLVAYRDLVLRVAKELYRQRFGRARVPKGFESSFQLALQEIRPGSAVLALSRVSETEDLDGQTKLPVDWDPFEAARDLVTEYVDAIGTGRSTPELPENVIPLFGNFGKHLRGGEELVFASPDGARRVAYTQAIRKQIVLQRADTYQKEVELTGTVVALDVERSHLRLRTDDGNVEVEFPGFQSTQLANALRDAAFTKVELLVVASFDKEDRLKRIDEVKDLSVVDVVDESQATRIERRLGELRSLEPGWSDGAGEVPTQETVDWVRQVVMGLMALDLVPPPWLYPTEAGHVRAEWTFKDWEVSAEFNFGAAQVALSAVNVTTSELREEQLTFTGAPDEDVAVAEFVSAFREGAARG